MRQDNWAKFKPQLNQLEQQIELTDKRKKQKAEEE